MEIKLDNIPFQEVFTAAIMQALDQSKKEEMIKGALQYLMTKSGNNYSNKTPLQEAFEIAIRAESIQYIRDFLSKDESFKQTISKLITDAIESISTKSREVTVSKIADKIIEGLYSKDY